jgi:hypothetical protein
MEIYDIFLTTSPQTQRHIAHNVSSWNIALPHFHIRIRYSSSQRMIAYMQTQEDNKRVAVATVTKRDAFVPVSSLENVHGCWFYLDWRNQCGFSSHDIYILSRRHTHITNPIASLSFVTGLVLNFETQRWTEDDNSFYPIDFWWWNKW